MNVAVQSLIDESIKSPRYHQVYSLLKGWVFDGTYPPGSKLPAEFELCTTFGVSRITTRKAIDMLAAEKLLIRIQGKGTYVTEDLADAPNQGDMEQLIRKTTRLARNSKVKSVEIKEVTADEQTRTDLDLPEGSQVQQISFVRHSGGAPVGYRVAYVRGDLGLNFTVEELKKEQMLSLLEKKGVKISGADQLLGASLADSRKASLLNTTVGAPLVRIRLVVFDDCRMPIERSTAYYLAERYEHHVYLSRSSGSTAGTTGKL